LIYHNNDNHNPPSSTSSNILSVKSSGQVILQQPPYDEYIIEDCKARVLEAEKLYNDIVDQILCEVVNENVAKQSGETMQSSLPTLPLEEGGADDDKQN